MNFMPVILPTDALLLILLALLVGGLFVMRRRPWLASGWRQLAANRAGMASLTLLLLFAAIGVLDSLHYRVKLDAKPGQATAYAVEVLSVLDAIAAPLRQKSEKTYSAPLDWRLFAKENLDSPAGQVRDFPRLKYGAAHLKDPEKEWSADVAGRIGTALGLALIVWVMLAAAAKAYFGRQAPETVAWRAVLATLAGVFVFAFPAVALCSDYHIFGTDKVGQDVFYLTLKSIRTALIIGTLTTLVMLPFATALGIAAGYLGGWVDDVIQYVYTTLNSIPGVLLIAASVLMMQVVIDTHPQWFATAAERADARLLALCFILGLTNWTGLCRLLRGETLKLRELEYVQAARSFGISSAGIMLRHLLPNLMHIVLISVVMDFSSLVLSEAVLSYVGIGVDANTISFGTMINAARLELAREPMVWWSLAAAFVFMVTLVLAANLFADAVRDAFDPRLRRTA